MNKKLVIAVILFALLGIGGYYAFTLQNSATRPGHSMEAMDSNSPNTQSLRGYEIEVTSVPTSIAPEEPVTIQYVIKNDQGEIVKDFATVHEKIMHFIVVRKDLAYFLHLHPEFNETSGEFSVVVTFPESGPYRLFPDFTPNKDNPQKLPATVNHDLEVGQPGDYAEQNVVPDTERTKTYADYSVTAEFPATIKKQTDVTYSVNVSQNGTPVTNLQQYLGALGHSVILKEGSLDFIHTHALEAGAEAMEGHSMEQESNVGSTGPKISFATSFPESGVYKVFTQFQHEGNIMTTNYVVNVE
jgi:hypothetical protein